ncbi:hypothetical protein COCOR_05672 [Corallococcus coralloides DSM 2259]|uniref:DUF3396 domain-containing protein n=1 Tax=Corallococcus coralloides (strain ATCC 25202 / DSM 2259 / NBRC 100086 / M2) TaxID=1144275 RepID=H8N276_CORCM|nr:DUF3396 domain-containing protein [Corallococcus coralloides]AFE06509.1 hypothetical protein COCOR_05672 [Corallococcus coralloides DSM 2259]
MLLRDGVSIAFYLRHSHQDVTQRIEHTLHVFQQAIAPASLAWYCDYEGDFHELDSTGREFLEQEFHAPHFAYVRLADHINGVGDYQFFYDGQWREQPDSRDAARRLSAVSLWLPTEFLEAQGSHVVHELALKLSADLPFASGHAGLAFNGQLSLLGVGDLIHRERLRHPGMDVPDESASHYLDQCIPGVHWMNFLGPPVLTELGGVEALRGRLKNPGTTVQSLSGGRAVITLGCEPDAGDVTQSPVLPAYRELARVLEPWLYFQGDSRPWRDTEEQRRWERRFLD